MTRSIRIEPEADEDLAQAFGWYEKTNPGFGPVFIDAMREAVARLAEVPNGSTTVPGMPDGVFVRRVFARGFPYMVVFVEEEDQISVVAFAHMKRRPGYWHSRLPT